MAMGACSAATPRRGAFRLATACLRLGPVLSRTLRRLDAVYASLAIVCPLALSRGRYEAAEVQSRKEKHIWLQIGDWSAAKPAAQQPSAGR